MTRSHRSRSAIRRAGLPRTAPVTSAVESFMVFMMSMTPAAGRPIQAQPVPGSGHVDGPWPGRSWPGSCASGGNAYARRRRPARRPTPTYPGACAARSSPTWQNMSVGHYTRLEQARGPHPSPRTLDALTRALRLSLAERTHLFRRATPSWRLLAALYGTRGCYVWVGKPRLTPPWDGSSQRLVTTLPRVKKCTPSAPWAWVSPNSDDFQPPNE